jgi:hypothetical protein
MGTLKTLQASTVRCVASQNQLYSRIFSCIFVGSRPVEDIPVISCRCQAEPKNARKNLCFLPPWPSAEAIFLRPWQGMNVREIRQILEVLAALSLGLIYALVTLTMPTFFVIMSL